MKGIIVKPTLCCGSMKSLGRIVLIEGVKKTGTATCQACGNTTPQNKLNHYMITDSFGTKLTCEKSRIKILPDDFDNNDEVIVEKELETV